MDSKQDIFCTFDNMCIWLHLTPVYVSNECLKIFLQAWKKIWHSQGQNLTPEQINPRFITCKSKTRIPRMENMDQNLQFHNLIPLYRGLPLDLCQTFHRALLSTGNTYTVSFPGKHLSYVLLVLAKSWYP